MKHEIDDAQHHDGLPHADRVGGLEMIHQHVSERRADHRAAAKAHDRHAGRHAAPVREPFDQRRDRRNIAKAQADAADHAERQPQQPELMDDRRRAPRQEAAAPAECRDDAGLARPGALEPAAEHGRRQSRGNDASSEGDEKSLTRQSQLCVNSASNERHVLARRRLSHAERARQRQPEHAEAVGHADAEMDGERRGRDEPAVETGASDDIFARKEARLLAAGQFQSGAQVRPPKTGGFHPLLSLFMVAAIRVIYQCEISVAR